MTYKQVRDNFVQDLAENAYLNMCTEDEMKMVIEALEKQIPKKPRETRCALMCANCGHKITEKGCKKLNRFYCKKCGQAIDWRDDIGTMD